MIFSGPHRELQLRFFNVTNQINNAVNANLIKTEPDIQKLSSNLKGAIPDQATDLAGINSLKTASADAQTAQTAVSKAGKKIGMPSFAAGEPQIAAIPETSSALIGGATPSGENSVAAKMTVPPYSLNWRQTLVIPQVTQSAPIPEVPTEVESEMHARKRTNRHPVPEGMTDTEYYALLDLQSSIYRVNLKISEVTRVAGSATGTVDNSKCPILAKKAGEVKALTLNPDGDIVVAPGAKATITLQGTTDPYVRPLFSQNVCNAVTATLRGNTMDVAATDETVAGFYPFFIGDGPTGRAIDVMVSKVSKDTGDDVNMECPDTKKEKTPGEAKIFCPSAFPGPLVQLNVQHQP